MNHIDLDGRRAIVTGASTGLGRAIVARLKASGARVANLDIAEPAAGESDLYRRCDVTDEDAVAGSVASVAEAFGGIDILVNNAGIEDRPTAIADTSAESWRRVLDVNLTGAFLCCRAVVPHMVGAGYGRIVNIASLKGKEAPALSGAYAASKAGLIALTKTLAKETATMGVLVNCVTPTAIDGGMGDDDAPERAAVTARIPMGRYGTMDEVAAMVAWICSAECSFTTGAVFDLSGGRATW